MADHGRTSLTTLAGILALLSCTATPCAADDTRYVLAGAVGGSSQPPGESEQPYLGPGFGGTSLSAVGFLDVVPHPMFSAGAEMSVNGAITAEQFQKAPGGGNHLATRHHDWIFMGMAKARTPSSARLQIAAGGGAGVAHRHTERNGFFVRDFPPGVSEPISETLTDNVFALTGAVEGTLAVTPRFGIIALFRVYKLRDTDRQPDGVVKRGVSSVIARYGAGGQFRF